MQLYIFKGTFNKEVVSVIFEFIFNGKC